MLLECEYCNARVSAKEVAQHVVSDEFAPSSLYTLVTDCGRAREPRHTFAMLRELSYGASGARSRLALTASRPTASATYSESRPAP